MFSVQGAFLFAIYNPGKLIVEALQSIFSQTFTDWELILIEDGSNDESISIINKIKDPRIKVMIDRKHMGLVYRLNQLIDFAEGEYFARMDADDIMHPERLERQILALETNKDIDVVTSPVFILNDERKVVGIMDLKPKGDRGLINAFKRGILVHPTVTTRRNWYMKNRYDPNFPRAEDRELFIRTIKTVNILYLSEPLLFYYFPAQMRLKEFLQSYSSERRVILRYGPGLLGTPMAYKLWLRSMLKSSALVSISKIGKTDLFIKYRHSYDKITLEKQVEAEKILSSIREARIPGLG